MSDTFCPLPWIAVAMRNNGDLRVCAHSNNSSGRGLVLKKDQTYFNAANDSLQDFRNTSLLKSIRSSMLAGQWHENCIRCQKEAQAGVRARIHYERDLRQSILSFEKAVAATEKDGSIDIENVPLSLLEVRFGNQCNLACRTCNPTESSRWYAEHREMYGDSFQYGDIKLELTKAKNGRVELNTDFFNWYESPSFSNNLPEILRDVSQIYMAGGEPLKTKAHSDFLAKIIELGYQDRISIEYNTNGYVIPDQIWHLWEKFKEVKIGLSIDSIFEMNDYIRYPSQWDLLSKNMDRLDQTGNQMIVWLCLTVHCYNIFYLPEIIEWRIKANFKKINNSLENIVFSDHPLHNPKHLNIQILPLEVKMKIREKFEKFKEKIPFLIKDNSFMSENFEESSGQIINFLDGYIKLMFQEDLSQTFPKFIQYTEKLDQLREESFQSIFPEFKKLLEGR